MMTALYLSNIELLVRLVAALVFGGLIGAQRVMAHKKAGMRTYALVSMGSALFVLVSQLVALEYPGAAVDVTRIASQIIVGVGFLGGGLIIFKGSNLTGLTTAAGLWVAAGVGMATGFGYYLLGLVASLLTLFIFTILWNVEQEVKEYTAEN